MRKQMLEIVSILEAEPNLFDEVEVESHAHNTCVILTLGALVFITIKNTFRKHHFWLVTP